jgi:hypothetical protein
MVATKVALSQPTHLMRNALSLSLKARNGWFPRASESSSTSRMPRVPDRRGGQWITDSNPKMATARKASG